MTSPERPSAADVETAETIIDKNIIIVVIVGVAFPATEAPPYRRSRAMIYFKFIARNDVLTQYVCVFTSNSTSSYRRRLHGAIAPTAKSCGAMPPSRPHRNFMSPLYTAKRYSKNYECVIMKLKKVR